MLASVAGLAQLHICSFWVQAEGEVSSWRTNFMGMADVSEGKLHCTSTFQAPRKGMESCNLPFVTELHGLMAKCTSYREG